MAENLNYEAKGSRCYGENRIVNKYYKSDDDIELSDAEIQANCEKYGRLYDFETAKNVCPKSWHLPSATEWDILYRYVDNTNSIVKHYYSKTAGKLLKAKSGWNDKEGKSGNGTDDFGFSALPSGIGYDDCIIVLANPGGCSGDYIYHFRFVGNQGNWWSTSESNADRASYRCMFYDNEFADWQVGSKKALLSVRCLQDTPAPPKGETR